MVSFPDTKQSFTVHEYHDKNLINLPLWVSNFSNHCEVAFSQGKDISLVGGRKQDRFRKRWGKGEEREGRVKGQNEKQKVGGQKRGLIHDQERS